MIVLVEPDPFLGITNDLASYIPTTQYKRDANSTTNPQLKNKLNLTEAADITEVSRPLMGISVKPDTHAFVQVIDETGKVLKVFNKLGVKATPSELGITAARAEENPLAAAAGAAASAVAGVLGNNTDKKTKDGAVTEGNSNAWTDWLLQSVREERVEKIQIVETFGSSFLHTYGEKPRVLVFTAVLLNTDDFNWRAIFWENWDKYFRATKLVEKRARLYLSFDDILVEGYPINASAVYGATDLSTISINFTLFITNYVNLTAASGFANAARSTYTTVGSGFAMGGKELSLKDSRVSLIEMLGFKGATAAGDAVGGGVAGNLLANAIDLAEKGLWAAGRGEAQFYSFLRAATLRGIYEGLSLASDLAVRQLEDSGIVGGKKLKRGEVNAWFGYVGAILESVDMTDWTGSTGLASGAVELLKLGSIQRIVQALSYQTAGLITQGLPSPKPGGMAKVNNTRDFRTTSIFGPTTV